MRLEFKTSVCHFAALSCAGVLLCFCSLAANAQAGRRGLPVPSQTIGVPLPIPPPRVPSRRSSGRVLNQPKYEASVEELERERKAVEACGAEVVEDEAIERMIASGEVFKRDSLTTPVRILEKPDPVYTRRARGNSTSGVVRLRVVFGTNGRITHIEVADRLPDELTLKSIQAACGIRFAPATKDGQPVAQAALVIYRFEIY